MPVGTYATLLEYHSVTIHGMTVVPNTVTFTLLVQEVMDTGIHAR